MRKALTMIGLLGLIIGFLLVGYLLLSILRPEKF